MKIGIAGVGAIGGALNRWYLKNGVMPSLYDPPRGLTGKISDCDAVFICVPAPTNPETWEQDLTIVNDILTMCNVHQMIFLRSSVLPGTCDKLTKDHSLRVFAMPEFLTERVADYDMQRQDIICGVTEEAHKDFVFDLFLKKKNIIPMKNIEAELSKYAHNGFGTVKVAFANMVYELAKAVGADYEHIRAGVLMSGFINAEHTLVPGPDGRLGYGGKCFPKDMEALIELMESNEIDATWLTEMQADNERKRGKILQPCPHSFGLAVDSRLCADCMKEGRR